MNNLISPSSSNHHPDIESGISITGINLLNFFESVESVKQDLTDLDSLYDSLRITHRDLTESAHTAASVKSLRSSIDRDMSLALSKARLIKVRIKELDESNALSRTLPKCEAGSSTDRTRISVVGGVRGKVVQKMGEFERFRERVGEEYRETVKRRVFTVTGEEVGEDVVEDLIQTGESETFLLKAIHDQGKGQVLDTIAEIHERHDALKDIEKSLKELHQTFLDMAVMVHSQGEQLDSIEAHVGKANSFVKGGTEQLNIARKYQKNAWKWIVFVIILLLIVALIIVLSLHPWTKKLLLAFLSTEPYTM